jgi:hypothetical protein
MVGITCICSPLFCGGVFGEVILYYAYQSVYLSLWDIAERTNEQIFRVLSWRAGAAIQVLV